MVHKSPPAATTTENVQASVAHTVFSRVINTVAVNLCENAVEFLIEG